MDLGSALESEEQALRLPRLVPRPPGTEPHFLRKAKLPKQINHSVKSSLGERRSQLAQPRSSKENCSRSLRRKQQILLLLLRSSLPARPPPGPQPPFPGPERAPVLPGAARDSTASPSGSRGSAQPRATVVGGGRRATVWLLPQFYPGDLLGGPRVFGGPWHQEGHVGGGGAGKPMAIWTNFPSELEAGE